MKIYLVFGSLFESRSDDENIVAIFKDKEKAELFCKEHDLLDFNDRPNMVERYTND